MLCDSLTIVNLMLFVSLLRSYNEPLVSIMNLPHPLVSVLVVQSPGQKATEKKDLGTGAELFHTVGSWPQTLISRRKIYLS